MSADALLLPGAYLLGSVPSGYLLVRLFRGLDVREHGSHNVGAINVFRVGGAKLGVLTLLAGIGKALLAVLAAGALTALAMIGELPWPVVAIPLGGWGAALLLPRLPTGRWWCISPATMAAIVAVPVATFAAHPAPAYEVLSLLLCALALARHRNNIRRLRAGTEPRLGRA